jgi:hypothetical protein
MCCSFATLNSSMAALAILEADKLNVRASFHTGLQLPFLAAVFFFFIRLPLTRRYTLTNGSEK